jgi:uncharacterized protein YbjT (DUF2867 family)
MNITITGSLGHISKPLTEELVQKGHSVTVISSKVKRQTEIEAIGAKAAIGTMEDLDFLSATTKICNNHKQAIQHAGVKHVVHLSSVGAHTDKGVGLLELHFIAENILKQLPNDVSIKSMRPVGFYNNMLGFIPTIKAQNAIISNYGGDEKEPWVSPLDIATVIAEEIEKPFNGRETRYIASDEVSPNEAAKILGEAIGKPDLKWLTISDEQFLDGLLSSGMNPQIAKGFTEMNASSRNGVLYKDYNNNKPTLGKIKLKDFTKEFAIVFSQG